jgi:uncharacterized membrane protein YsdA (DUF1294 family)
MEFVMPLPGSTGYMLLCLGAWITGASAAAYVVYGLDLRRAAAGGSRVPQQTLLWIAGVGGWPGALAAELRSRVGRHTGGFRGLLNVIVLLQTILLVMLLVPAGSLPATFDRLSALAFGEMRTEDSMQDVRRFGPVGKVSASTTASTYLCRRDSC